MARSCFFAHSGGVTSVFNATAISFIKQAKRNGYDKIWVGKNGLNGLLSNQLIPAHHFSDPELDLISQTPSSVFGSSRIKLAPYAQEPSIYETILKRCQSLGIDSFCYNGGNDSQDTGNKLHRYFQATAAPIQVVGLPKTIDNDLEHTHCSPGYGSVAKYVAMNTLHAALDIKAMHQTSSKVFVFEVMGRDAGWIAAASALAGKKMSGIPHMILLPEKQPSMDQILRSVNDAVHHDGFCIICASEGIKLEKDDNNQPTDPFGHKQYSGVAQAIKRAITQELGLKTHIAISSILQRSAAHCMSATDVKLAQLVGLSGADYLAENGSGDMISIQKTNESWTTAAVPMDQIANRVKQLPPEYIASNGLHVSKDALAYIEPLIQGETPQSFQLGLPEYFQGTLHVSHQTKEIK